MADSTRGPFPPTQHTLAHAPTLQPQPSTKDGGSKGKEEGAAAQVSSGKQEGQAEQAHEQRLQESLRDATLKFIMVRQGRL